MAMILTAFPKEYDADVMVAVMEELAAVSAAWREYYNISTTGKYIENWTTYAGMTQVPEWGDGVDLPIDEAMKIADLAVTQVFYGLGFKVSRKHVKYGQSNVIADWATSLGQSAAQTYHNLHVATLDNAFATNLASLGTKPLCSATHATAGGGTRSNLLAAAALSAANLEALRLKGDNWVDYRGLNRPLDFAGAKLVTNPALRRTAQQILQSEGEAGTAQNQINVHRGVFQWVNEQLSSTTAYFLIGRGNGLKSVHGMTPTPIRYVEPNGNLVHGLEFDFGVGVKHADGVVGCAGA